jgi:hypothetical protein
MNRIKLNVALFITLAIILGYTSALGTPLIQFLVGTPVYLPIVIRELTPTPSPTPLSTPTPTPTLTPTATSTPLPAGVLILSSNTIVPYGNTLYVIGEVLNNTGSSVGFVRINATLRDANGNVVDSDYSYAFITIISAGMKSPFRVIFFSPPSWSTYDLVATWDTTSAQTYPLELLNSTSYFDDYDEFHVVGEVRNQYSEDRTSVEAYVTLYNVYGQVIGVGSTYTNPNDLVPGQTASFDVGISSWVGAPDRNQVASFALLVLDD